MRVFLLLVLCFLSASVKAEDFLRGQYSMSGDGDSFQPCDSEKKYRIYPLKDIELIKSRIHEYVKANYLSLGQPIYFVFEGRRFDKGEIGTPFDDSVHIYKILEMQKLIPNECGKNS